MSDRRLSARPDWRRMYKSAQWGAIRQEVLQAQPICKICERQPSAVCDHVQRHNGDALKFFAGPFQALCYRCHNSLKQSWETGSKVAIGPDGWPVGGKAPHQIEKERQSFFDPVDLRASKPRLTIVVGPPASGKTTYVAQFAGPRDVIIDADAEADRLMISRYTDSSHELRRVIAAKNAKLRALATSDAPAAWYCFLGAQTQSRASLDRQLQPAQTIVLLTPRELCVERIKNRRTQNEASLIAAVDRWYKNYTPRPGERVIR